MYRADSQRYDGRMPYRRCGDSGISLPALSLGLWHNFGQADDFEEARRMLRRAFDRGITHFDLANNYGPPPGAAEETAGRLLAEDFASHRDELIISTKAGHLMWDGPYGEWGSRKHMLSSLDQSLRRLRLDYVDIFYAHRPDPHTRLEETVGALVTAVNSGRALYVGLSKFPPKMLRRAVRMLGEAGIRCLIYQPPYSILDRWPERSGIFDWLKSRKIGSAVFSPLAQGMLTGKYISGIPETSRAARPEGFLQPDQVEARLKQVRALNKLTLDWGHPLHHLALRWALRRKVVATAIIGTRTCGQLDSSLAALEAPELDDSLLDAIDKISPAPKA